MIGHNPEALEKAKQEANSLPLDKIDVSNWELYWSNTHLPYFERLRNEAPVHYCPDSPFGPYWSVTRYDDIMKVDTNHRVFSSQGSIQLADFGPEEKTSAFIRKDGKPHREQRLAASKAVTPDHLAVFEPLIRSRTQEVLDSLPRGEVFDWVEKVSMELTTRMLATLFDFPFDERHLLPYWTEVAASAKRFGHADLAPEERMAELEKCFEYFQRLWSERKGNTEGQDFLSVLANHPNTKDMLNDPGDFLGNIILLIIGGNDTTRNSMSGSILFFNQFPGELAKLKADPGLIPNMVSEVIRLQTPLAHMRRTALEDVELGGQQIKKGDKVVMWYCSGNRDADKFDDPDTFRIDRENAKNHIAFGFGVHRCMGNRVGELQLRILWEEILKRFDKIEVVGEPVRAKSNMIQGYAQLPVRIPAWSKAKG